MSKSPLYQSFDKGNSNDLLEFLISKGVWNSPELDQAVTVNFSINGEQTELSLYRNIPQPKTPEILNKFGFSEMDFKEYMRAHL